MHEVTDTYAYNDLLDVKESDRLNMHGYIHFLLTGGSHLKFTDVEVCKPFLLGICINEFFTDTVSHHKY